MGCVVRHRGLFGVGWVCAYIEIQIHILGFSGSRGTSRLSSDYACTGIIGSRAQGYTRLTGGIQD